MTPHDEQDLRVELRRFLGGIPFSHEREITSTERGELRKEVAPYVGFGLLFFLLSVAVFAVTIFEAAVMGPVMVTVGLALSAVPISCYYWMRPALQTLRSGRLSVYLGRMNNIVAFDAVQAHYHGRPEVAAQLHRYVEVLAIGKGERIWRFEGLPNHEALSGVRPVWVATVPDRDERGERRLTDEEVRELRLRASEFRKARPFLLRAVAATFVSLVLFGFTIHFTWSWVALIVWLGLEGAIWIPYIDRLLFAQMLSRDARKGVVRNGWLSSGMPWVIDGEPARWRTGRSRGGTNSVTKEQAIALERVQLPPLETS